MSKKRYSRTLSLSSPIPVRNASEFSVDVSANLIQSVRYWPLNTGLQIDMFSNEQEQVFTTLTQLGGYFPGWITEMIGIVGQIARLSTWTKKDATHAFRSLKPAEMYELSPYGTQIHFNANDLIKTTPHDDINFDMMNHYYPSEYYESDFFRLKAFTFSRYFNTDEIISVLLENPNCVFRTIIRPVDSETADKYKQDIYNECPRIFEKLDLNCAVVYARCFIGSKTHVPVGLKRIATTMSTNTELTKVDHIEIDNIWKNPLNSVMKYPCLSPTAASYMRLPTLDIYDAKQTEKNKGTDLKKIVEMQKEYFAQVEKDILEKVNNLIDTKIADAKFMFDLEKNNYFHDVVEDSKNELLNKTNELTNKIKGQITKNK